MESIKHHHHSFKNAINGVIWVFTTQPNFKIHFFLSLLSLATGFLLNISYLEMTILVMTIIFGFTVEMVNTSIESITDLISAKWNRYAKIAKDVSAGMMLLTAIGAILIAGLIFIPHVLDKIY